MEESGLKCRFEWHRGSRPWVTVAVQGETGRPRDGGAGRVGGGARTALSLSGIISHTSHTCQPGGADAPEVGLGSGTMGAGAVIRLHLDPWTVTSWVPLTSAEEPCGEAPSPSSHS